MRIGILGTGVVGGTLGSKLIEGGHQVMMGSRTRGGDKAVAWVKTAGAGGSHGAFNEAAAFGEMIFNCTAGATSLQALELAGAEQLGRKILIDVSNPLDFSRGFPPSLTVCNTDSVGEQLQRAFPQVRVVKTLNTVTALLMVNPKLVPGRHNLFLSGNDDGAKTDVTRWLGQWFGWPADAFIDLGDITTARGPEMLLSMWIRLYGTFQNSEFNFSIVRAS